MSREDGRHVRDLGFDEVMRRLRGRSFAVLATADDQGKPQAAGVVYAVARQTADFYVMTRRHLMKARNIGINPSVSLVVPLTRRLFGALPPPCVQFQGTAEILDHRHAAGTAAFSRFVLGRVILRMYEEFARRGETRVCFLRIQPGPTMFAYAVGTPIWRLVGRMEAGTARIEVPAEFRGRAAGAAMG